MASTNFDFIVTNHGSIFLVLPVTPAANIWVQKNLPVDAMRFGDSVAVEHRYISEIIKGIQADGLWAQA